MKLRIWVVAVLAAWAGACSAPKYTFQVEIMNIGATPLSADFVKVDGPAVDGFTGPEHVAIYAPDLSQKRWGTLIGPGQTKTIGPKRGKFEPGSHAVLRVYAGDLPIDQLITFGRKDPGRLDIYLVPGRSGYVIDQKNGVLKASPLDDLGEGAK